MLNNQGMISRFPRINYSSLSARQKENYNFQKLSAVLADYGFATLRLSDDWNGADFIAQHLSGETLKVQLKSRFCVYSKYQGKDLWIAFPSTADWYIYPHDPILQSVLELTDIRHTDSWSVRGGYSWAVFPEVMRTTLAPFLLLPAEKRAVE